MDEDNLCSFVPFATQVTMSDLVFTPAHQLAQMIRDRTVSSVEVLDAYLAQIAKHNTKLSAICTLDEERARQRAKLADEALARGENWGHSAWSADHD